MSSLLKGVTPDGRQADPGSPETLRPKAAGWAVPDSGSRRFRDDVCYCEG
ncbi:hypothetical protein [Brevundimonas naejangsanensis]|nr:hypothetical protein [Brevundimonas naejangsanensis]